MFRRTVRIACLVIGLLATAGLISRAIQNEDALTREGQSAVTASKSIAKTSELILDIRASLHAYVAPGQGLPFWAKRAQENLDALRQNLIALDVMVSPKGGSLAESLDAVDQLTAAERRARTHVSRGEMQLAGDVIFTEVRDLLAGAGNQIDSVRVILDRRHDQRSASIRNEQVLLAAGAIGLWMAIALLLAPTPASASAKDPAQWRSELKETLQKKQAASIAEVPAAAPLAVTPPAPIEPIIPAVPLQELSEICGDLSALSEPAALQGALERVNVMLNATGLIVWVASDDGEALSPVATQGFDPALVARIGRVARDSANVTAAAFRENQPKVTASTAAAPAAIAVAMCGPNGPAGVLSVELKAGESVTEAKVALTSIVAAQLATLAMPFADPAFADISDDDHSVELEPKRAAL